MGRGSVSGISEGDGQVKIMVRIPSAHHRRPWPSLGPENMVLGKQWLLAASGVKPPFGKPCRPVTSGTVQVCGDLGSRRPQNFVGRLTEAMFVPHPYRHHQEAEKFPLGLLGQLWLHWDFKSQKRHNRCEVLRDVGWLFMI